MKKILLLVFAISGMLFLNSCVTPVNISEVLQVPKGTKLYTTHNIWYEIPWNISSINYQKGKIIPFGTAIKLISADPTRVRFQVLATGRHYTMIYHEKWGMQPVNDYIKQLVSVKSRDEQAKGISPSMLNIILKGKVEKGMTRKEVTFAFGPPSPHRTPLIEGSTWIYWENQFSSKRVIFKNDKVIDIIK